MEKSSKSRWKEVVNPQGRVLPVRVLRHAGKRMIKMRSTAEGIEIRMPHGAVEKELFPMLFHHWPLLEQGYDNARAARVKTGQRPDYVYYQGERYVAEMVPDTRSFVDLGAQKIIFHMEQPSPEALFALWKQWCAARAQAELPERFWGLVHSLQAAGLVPQKLVLKKMRASWGRCDSNGQIALAQSLICVPVLLQQYVMIHELCHLRHLNHGKDFYRLLEQLLPEWRVQRQCLGHWRYSEFLLVDFVGQGGGGAEN